MARTNNLSNFLTDVADAIRTKKGSEEPIAAADFDTEIANLPSGDGAVVSNDVNFYDYDGTLVYSYSKNDFLALTELPANPSHTGLTAQGWNWTLANAKDYVDTCGILDIGQKYITSDGKTRIYISLKEGRTSPYLGFAINGTATVDWGDNTTSTVTGSGTAISSVVYTQHSYAEEGDYIITLDSEDTIHFWGTEGTGSYLLVTVTGGTMNQNLVYLNSITKIEIGSNVVLENHAFCSLRSMETVVLPDDSINKTTNNGLFMYCSLIKHITTPNITTLGNYFGYGCYNMKSIALNREITSVGGEYPLNSEYSLKRLCCPPLMTDVRRIAQYDFSLEEIVFPLGLTSDLKYACEKCYNLRNIYMPNKSVKIGDLCFNSAYVLKEFTFPSNITGCASAFGSCASLQKIIINCNIGSNTTFTLGGGLSSLREVVFNGTVQKIPGTMFSGCTSLPSIVIPSTVATIEAQAFYNCFGMRYYDFSQHESIPTLANTNAFNNIPTDCKIIVPDDLYEDWIAANNWSDSTIVDHIISKTNWDALQNT